MDGCLECVQRLSGHFLTYFVEIVLLYSHLVTDCY